MGKRKESCTYNWDCHIINQLIWDRVKLQTHDLDHYFLFSFYHRARGRLLAVCHRSLKMCLVETMEGPPSRLSFLLMLGGSSAIYVWDFYPITTMRFWFCLDIKHHCILKCTSLMLQAIHPLKWQTAATHLMTQWADNKKKP